MAKKTPRNVHVADGAALPASNLCFDRETTYGTQGNQNQDARREQIGMAYRNRMCTNNEKEEL
jgi:hypothetical protein